MQTRTITVDYARPRGYDVGYRAENNFTLLALPVPEELEGADSYRVYFESTVGEYLQTELLTPADGYVTVKITSDIVPEPGNMAAQLVAFADGEIVGYAPMITGSAKVSIPDGTERLSHSLAAEIALNTAARHSHDNKAVLDKFAESKDGKPTYDGQALGGGAGDFIIKMTVASDDDNYTVTSCDKTMEQIDAAFNSDKNIVLTVAENGETNKYILPLIYAAPGLSYFFESFYSSYLLSASIDKRDGTTFGMIQMSANAISYSNDTLPNISTVGGALDDTVSKAHMHGNKNTLDKLAESNGSLTYNGKSVGGAWYVDVTQSDDAATANKTAAEVYAAYEAGYSVYARILIKNIPYAIPLKAAVKNGNTILLGFSTSGANNTRDVTYPIVTWGGNTWSVQVFDLLSLFKAKNVTLNDGSSVQDAVDKLSNASHTHDNKSILDKLSAVNGKLQYDGSDVGLKGDKGDKGADGKTPVKGTDYWTTADKAEIVADTLAALPTWTGGSY